MTSQIDGGGLYEDFVLAIVKLALKWSGSKLVENTPPDFNMILEFLIHFFM